MNKMKLFSHGKRREVDALNEAGWCELQVLCCILYGLSVRYGDINGN